jgi:hypothetical protein
MTEQESREREGEILRLTQMIEATEAGHCDAMFASVSFKMCHLTDLRARIADLRAGGPLPAFSNDGFADLIANARTYVLQPDGNWKRRVRA